MFDDRKDPGKRENNPTEKGANLQEQCPGAGRGDECTRGTELVSRAWTTHQVQWMDHKVDPEANSCGQGDLVLGMYGYSLLMVLNSCVLQWTDSFSEERAVFWSSLYF